MFRESLPSKNIKMLTTMFKKLFLKCSWTLNKVMAWGGGQKFREVMSSGASICPDWHLLIWRSKAWVFTREMSKRLWLIHNGNLAFRSLRMKLGVLKGSILNSKQRNKLENAPTEEVVMYLPVLGSSQGRMGRGGTLPWEAQIHTYVHLGPEFILFLWQKQKHPPV